MPRYQDIDPPGMRYVMCRVVVNSNAILTITAEQHVAAAALADALTRMPGDGWRNSDQIDLEWRPL